MLLCIVTDLVTSMDNLLIVSRPESILPKPTRRDFSDIDPIDRAVLEAEAHAKARKQLEEDRHLV